MTVYCSDRRPKHAKKFRHFSLTLALDPPFIRRGQKTFATQLPGSVLIYAPQHQEILSY
jgi:hypothetical protein